MSCSFVRHQARGEGQLILVLKAGIMTIMVETSFLVSPFFHNIRYGPAYVSIDMEYAV
ncbi:hypothetical protein SAMN05216378_5982 [Paenibacillus catalpae]|uniref:Uncharacterized protein n=1 Tax=Paenibacillus catalpae TaxID=1045775 RepID=A0A1I2HXI0_9BACL|nr:hypothetical protein SAMN05216378_5982 [Paenibacillus catalpae]